MVGYFRNPAVLRAPLRKRGGYAQAQPLMLKRCSEPRHAEQDLAGGAPQSINAMNTNSNTAPQKHRRHW